MSDSEAQPVSGADPQQPLPSPVVDYTPQLKPANNRKKKLLIAALILVVALAIVSAVLIARHKPTKNQAATNTKKDIPLLRVGMGALGGVPQYPTSYSYSTDTVDIALQLFEGLVGYKNQTEVTPLLATSWSNPNDTTWVFNLRHGVKFHDGHTMTAQDVKFSLDYAIQNSGNSNSGLFLASDMKQVSVTEPYQVTITTANPDAVLLSQLSGLGIIDSGAKLGDYDAGTGPYVVKPGTTPTADSIDLVAFNNYWGGHIYTRAVDITLYSNSDQLAADTAKGKFDLAGYFDSSQVSKIKNLHTFNVPDPGLNYVGVDTERASSPLQSLAARQAVSYGLNIPAILKAGGLYGQQDSQIVPLILPGHNPAIQNTPYDPVKAKQLLATVPNASSPITFAYPTGDGPQVTEMVKELTAVGFNVKPILVSDFNTFLNDTAAGKYDLFTEGDTSATVDGLSLLTDLLEDNQYYDNPKIDSLVAQAGSTLDQATRLSDMQQVASIVAANKPIIPLYTQDRLYYANPAYSFRADYPGADPAVYFWQVYQK